MKVWLFIGLVLGICLFNSCKKKDKVPPQVSLLYPSVDSFIQAGSIVEVSGNASDNDALELLVLQLKDSVGKILGSESYDIHAKELSFRFQFQMGDLYAQTGPHTLKGTVFDASGNTHSAETEINLIEVPLKHLKTFFIYTLPSGEGMLYSLDTLLQVNQERSLGLDVAFLKCDNRYQQLVFANSVSARLGALDPNYLSIPLFEVFEPNPTQIELITGLSIYADKYACSFASTPYCKVYKKDGTLFTSLSNINKALSSIHLASDRVFVGVPPAGPGHLNALEAYGLASKQLIQRKTLPFSIDYILEKDKEKLLCTGYTSSSKDSSSLIVLDYETWNEEFIITLPDSIKNPFLVGDMAYFYAEGQIQSLDLENSIRVPLVSIPNLTAMAYEFETETIYAFSPGNIRVISPTGTVIQQISAPNGPLGPVSFLMNK